MPEVNAAIGSPEKRSERFCGEPSNPVDCLLAIYSCVDEKGGPRDLLLFYVVQDERAAPEIDGSAWKVLRWMHHPRTQLSPDAP